MREVPTTLAKAIRAERRVRATSERLATLVDQVTHANEAGGMYRLDAYLERISG